MCMQSEPTETFQYTHFTYCHPQGAKKGFIKGEALRLLKTNHSKATFGENITHTHTHTITRQGLPR